jgi:hypothetical protein
MSGIIRQQIREGSSSVYLWVAHVKIRQVLAEVMP